MTLQTISRILLCLTGVILTSSASAQRYSLIDLGAFPHSASQSLAFAINNAGQVVGQSTIDGGFSHAAFWSNGSNTLSDLGTFGGHSNGADINSAGQIVGQAYISTNVHRAAYWSSASSAPINLGTLGGTHSFAQGINDTGQIVGASSLVGSSIHGFPSHATFWSSSTSAPVDLGTLGGAQSLALSINNAGQIVGVASTSSGESHATFWSNGMAAPVDLGTFAGGSGSIARSINDAGQIVGAGCSTNCHLGWFNATFWNSSTSAPTDLGTLAGGFASYANDINSSGQVVGFSYVNGTDGTRATYWDGSTETVVDLNNLVDSSHAGWVLQEARGINDVGQIVGYGVNALGQQHAFLLNPCETCNVSPIPEPETYSMLLAGLFLLGYEARRRKRFKSSHYAS